MSVAFTNVQPQVRKVLPNRYSWIKKDADGATEVITVTLHHASNFSIK